MNTEPYSDNQPDSLSPPSSPGARSTAVPLFRSRPTSRGVAWLPRLAIIQFVQQIAPNMFNGQPVNFYQTFNQAGGLVMWGAPISNPAPDPSNAQFIYQRFQRGIMHFAVGQGTRGILLADYLKSVMLGPVWAQRKGSSLPPDLNQQAQGSRQYAQYCPGETRWMCRPNDLVATDLTFAFEVG